MSYNKKTTKKYIKIKYILLITALLFSLQVGIVKADSSDENENIMQEQYDMLNSDDLMDNLPDSTQEILRQNELDDMKSDKIIGFNFFDFMSSLVDVVKNEFAKPFRLLACMIGIILLCSILEAMKDGTKNQSSDVFSVVAILAVCGIIIKPVSQCIIEATSVIRTASDFLLCYIPVFTGIVGASGKPVSALAYNGTLLAIVQVISQITSNILVPFLGVFLALSITGAVNPQLNIGSVTSGIKSAVIWVIGFLLTTFVGIFSVQGMVANSADTASVKATKFAVSSFVPVVGSAISEALNSVQGCLGLMKSTVGAFGIIACVFMFVPIIIQVLFYIAILKLSSTAGQLLNVSKLPVVLKSVADSLSIILGFLVSFALLVIVSTTIMISMVTS